MAGQCFLIVTKREDLYAPRIRLKTARNRNSRSLRDRHARYRDYGGRTERGSNDGPKGHQEIAVVFLGIQKSEKRLDIGCFKQTIC